METKFTLPEGTVTVRAESGDRVVIQRGDQDPVGINVQALAEGSLVIPGEGRGYAVRDQDAVWVHWQGRTWRLDLDRGRTRARGGGGGGLGSPMPGQVQKLLVAVGDRVEERQPLVVVEAMKMQIEIKAPHAGTVVALLAGEGEQVGAGVPLVELKATES